MIIYGESRGDTIGVAISGCPAGVELPVEDVQAGLNRREPGQSMITTSRGEPDAVVVNSGVQDGYTTGTPIGMIVQNKDTRSGRYEPYTTAPRPSHGDFTYSTKFGTCNWGGGGRSLARETVNWVAAGAVIKQVIEQSDHDIEIKAHVSQISNVEVPEVLFDEMREHTEENDVRCAHPGTTAEVQELIEEYQKEGDSIGGSIHFEVQGVPCGLGAPRFDSFSARLGQAFMLVPAATAFELGLGRETREWIDHDRNENWEFDEEGGPRSVGNNHGGIQGDTTTGELVYGELAPHTLTPIPKKQRTVDWETGEEKEIQVVGWHGLVLPPRDVPVVETMLYVTVLDFMLLGGCTNPDRLDEWAGEYDAPYHPSSPDNEQRTRFQVIVHFIPRA